MDKRSKILQIARYLETGDYSQTLIAKTLHVSKNQVSIVKKVTEQNGWTLAELTQMSDDELQKYFRRKDIPISSGPRETIYRIPDYEWMCKELLRPGVTKSLLYEEYVEECIRSGNIYYQKTQFYDLFERSLKRKSFSEIIRHKPAEEAEVDWTGDPAQWTDPDTGEVVTGWLFVGVLPFSGYGYAEVFPDMKLSNWITAHVHMFEYFGGTTRTLVCDNLKTGVIKHPVTGDAVLQPDYEAFANHYGMIVAPARVREPDDKPTVENLVGKLETHILARLRNVQCFSIEEYNMEVRRELDRFNAKPFQKKEGSRLTAYQQYESAEMNPLPSIPYEYFVKKTAMVQSNCCISCGKNYYSVPYQHIGERVTLRIYNDRLEVWSGAEHLCTHKLVIGKIGVYQTDNNHFPPYSSSYGDWNSDRFRRWAREYGPYTYEVIDRLFSGGGAEQKYYNGARSILKLADQYTRPRVEQACQLALRHYKRPVYRNIKAILYNGQDIKELAIPNTQSKQTDSHSEQSHVRGAEYYARKKD